MAPVSVKIRLLIPGCIQCQLLKVTIRFPVEEDIMLIITGTLCPAQIDLIFIMNVKQPVRDIDSPYPFYIKVLNLIGNKESLFSF